MTEPSRTEEMLLVALEDELLATTDEDILAGPGAADIVSRVQAMVEAQTRPRVRPQGLPARAAPRRDPRRRVPDPRRDSKRQMVDRVLVANPVARSLATRESVAIMDEDELDHLLARLRTLGLAIENDEKPAASQGD